VSEPEDVRDILLKEYAEAGHVARQHEQLTRTSASVFIPTLIALAGYVLAAGPDTSTTVRLTLAVVGFVASLLAANVVRRHQLYYRCYIARARAIESQLKVADQSVMNLYTLAERVKNNTFTISSKNAFIAFFVLSALLFAGSTVLFAFRVYCSAP
jgi:hypothetical protein